MSTPSGTTYSLPAVQNTPIKNKSSGCDEFRTLKPAAIKRYHKLREEMDGLFVGPMPVMEFLDSFLPLHEGREPTPAEFKNRFEDMPVIKQEPDMYEHFIKRVNGTRDEDIPSLIPGLKVVNTASTTDRNSGMFKVKPDCNIYSTDVDTTARITQMDKTLMDIEFKSKEVCDPFIDEGTPSRKINPEIPFEGNSNERRLSRGQLISYATEIHQRQHRCHSFSLFAAGGYARFLRWDRSGCVVTQRFDFRKHSAYLVEYLWRFSRADDVERGIDPTVSPAHASEMTWVKELLDKWKPDGEHPVLRMRVPKGDGTDEETYFVWGSLCRADSPTGRGTRGYPAVNSRTRRVVFLKDTWRPVHVDVWKESETLRLLNKHSVRNVPTFLAGDDLEVISENQVTCTHQFRESSWRRWNIDVAVPLVTRKHHRFVEDIVGIPLKHVRSMKVLMKVLYDAFVAHQDAYEKCNILHRDISGGNVLVTDNNRGILNDWDLAKPVDAMDKGARQHYRTGTWQFISARLLKNGKLPHTPQDDIESFFHVALYHGLRYYKHNHLANLVITMDNLFDEETYRADKTSAGGNFKHSLITDDEFLVPDLEFGLKVANHWFHQFRLALQQWYLRKHMPGQPQTLDDHTKVAEFWLEALDVGNWSDGDDYVGDQLAECKKAAKEALQSLTPVTEEPDEAKESEQQKASKSDSENQASGWSTSSPKRSREDDDVLPDFSQHDHTKKRRSNSSKAIVVTSGRSCIPCHS